MFCKDLFSIQTLLSHAYKIPYPRRTYVHFKKIATNYWHVGTSNLIKQTTGIQSIYKLLIYTLSQFSYISWLQYSTIILMLLIQSKLLFTLLVLWLGFFKVFQLSSLLFLKNHKMQERSVYIKYNKQPIILVYFFNVLFMKHVAY